ncbi:Mucin-associated surface protein (MASP), putative, partial [Trypanosoma cruzi]
MAMMMTGRVLLVCALCVLCCGAGGSFANEERTGLGSGGPPLESQELETPLQETQDLKVGSPNVNGKVPPTSSTHIEEAGGEDSDDNDEYGEEKDKKGENEKNKVQLQTHEGKNNEGASLPPPPPIPSGDPTAERENPQNSKT